MRAPNHAAAHEAVATADAHLNNAGLPTYTDLLTALRGIEWACTGVDYMETEYAPQMVAARAVLARHDSAMAGGNLPAAGYRSAEAAERRMGC